MGQLLIDRYKSLEFDIPTVEQGGYQEIVRNSGGKTVKTCLFAHFGLTTEEIIGKGRGVKCFGNWVEWVRCPTQKEISDNSPDEQHTILPSRIKIVNIFSYQ